MPDKLTTFAQTELKKLRERRDALHAHAQNVHDAFHKTLDLFEAGVKKIAHEESELRAELAELGNGAPILEEAFSDDPAHAQPHESAHLATVKAG